MDDMTPSLSIHAQNLLNTKSIGLDFQDFVAYSAELLITTDAVALLLAESAGLGAPLIYHYRRLLNKLRRRLADASDELEARQVDQENSRKSAERDEARPPLNRLR